MIKKLLIFLMVFGFFFWGCEEDQEPGVDCLPLVASVDSLLSIYASDRTGNNCSAYNDALQAVVDADCDVDSLYQKQIDENNCGCVSIEEEINIAYIAFQSEPNTENCIAYTTVLQASVDNGCDEYGVHQDMINNLNNCSDISVGGVDCLNYMIAILQAQLVYSMDSSNVSCNTYKDLLNSAIAAGCDTDGSLQLIFNNLDCEFDIITQEDEEEAIELVNDANAFLEDIFSDIYDSEDPDNSEDLIDLLDFSGAYSLYKEAQYLNPNNSDANFGVAVTGLMQVVQNQSFEDMVKQWDEYFSNNTPFEEEPSNNSVLGTRGFGLPLSKKGMKIPIVPFLNIPLRIASMPVDYVPQFSELQNIIRDIMLPYVDEGILALAKVEENSDYVFSISSDMQPDVGSSSLELDLTEVYIIDMMLHAIKAIGNTLIGHNFDFVTHDADGIVAELNLGSDFGTLNSMGESELLAGHEAMENAISKLETALNFLENETDNQDNDIIVQMENDSDYQEVRDALNKANDAITQPTWVSYYTYENVYEGNYYYEEEEIEDSVQIDIQQFFKNPIQDLKQMVPSYTITAGLDQDYDWDDQIISNYDSLNIGNIVSDIIDTTSSSWQYYSFSYWSTYYPHGSVDTSMHQNNINIPQIVIDRADQIVDSLANVYSDHIIEIYGSWYCEFGYGNSWGCEEFINLHYNIWEATLNSMYSYPIITWDADDYNEWKNSWPDPTMNGIFPNWTVDDLMEFLGFDNEDNWEKIWDWD